MANQILKTRIKNKVDSLTNWQSSSSVAENKLLNGEIAIVRVNTGMTNTNSETGTDSTGVELLLKVGDGSTPFDQLPWVSAKASDVYDWAKNPTIESVDVKVETGKTNNTPVYTTQNLSVWLKELNSTAISANTTAASAQQAVNDLVTDSKPDSIADRIRVALEALDVTKPTGAGNFVKTVTQTDGQITVEYGNISAADLPSGISSDKITISSKTLTAKMTEVDQELAGKLVGVASSAAADSATGPATFITGLSKDSSNNVTYKGRQLTVDDLPSNIPGSKIQTASLVGAHIIDGTITGAKLGGNSVTNVKLKNDISPDKILLSGTAGDTNSVTLTKKLNAIDQSILDITNSIKDGIHFVGTTTTILADGLKVTTIVVNGADHTASAGDVALYGEKEFIYTGTEWEELGDLTKAGQLESRISALSTADRTAHSFVTHIKRNSADKLITEVARPVAEDVLMASGSTETVESKFNSVDLKLTNIESSYIRVSNDKMYVGTATDEIIFDCGGSGV